ncbi:MAG: integrase arm-type DNA-binding domain-containing protein, partial [Oxalobacter sp.]|nr:integrase arm-type DNA-binding domain-containing protein [Oxalobacter sp.]
MATRLKRQLTDMQIKNAKPDAAKPYRLTDGEGLFLEVTPTGSKIWRMRARINNKQVLLTIGKYPAVQLASARKDCEEAHTLIQQGLDPRLVKKEKRDQLAAAATNTFENLAREWHENKLTGWKEKTASDIIHRLEREVFPAIGRIPISEVTHKQIIALLRTIESRGAFEIAKRTKANISRVFSYAVQVGAANRNPVADLVDVLKP